MPSSRLVVYRTTDLDTITTYREAIETRSEWADNRAFATRVTQLAQGEVDRLGPSPGLVSALSDMPVVFRATGVAGQEVIHRPVVALEQGALMVGWDAELPAATIAAIGDQWKRVASTRAHLVAMAEVVEEMSLKDQLVYHLHKSRFENFLLTQGSWDVADVMAAIWPTVERAVREGRL